MDEDEPEYVELEDLHPDDIRMSTAAFHAAATGAAPRTTQSYLGSSFDPGGDDDGEEEDGEEDDGDGEGPDGADGAEGAIGTPTSTRLFDPTAIEGILAGEDESTPLFNQLFGTVDYSEDDDGAVAGDLEELETQMAMESGQSRRRKRRRRAVGAGKGSRALNDVQSRLLGEANMAYTQGQYSDAIHSLHQIIRSAPYAHQAWFTLAMIHEELEDSVKALQFYLIAAHLTPRDSDLWKRLGEMSTKASQLSQAVYCYNKAIRLDRSDVDALASRSKAIDGFIQILNVHPDELSVIKDLARLYLSQGMPQKAITLFEEILANDDAEFGNEPGAFVQVEPESDDEDREPGEEWISRRIQFEETNMLAELYMEVDEYEVAIDFIKKQTRKLQGRWAESSTWDVVDNDEEYSAADDPESGRWLPPELRVKLGICRLWTDELDLARRHFAILRSYRVDEYPELFFEVADAYIKKKLFGPAMEVLEMLGANDSTNNEQLWARMATCSKEVGDLERSAQLLEAVIAARPGDVDAVLELAQVYTDLGDTEQAMRLVTQVEESARATGASKAGAAQSRALIEGETSDRKSSAREQTRRAEEEQAQLVNRTNFQKCKVLWGKWGEGDASDVEQSDLLRTARKLVQKFQTTKAFYPSDRSKKFSGVGRKKRSKAQNAGAQQALNNLVTRLRKSGEDGAADSSSLTSFQGLSFDEWLETFTIYSIALCRKLRFEEAQAVLQSAIDANVFYHDEQRHHTLRMLSIGIALQNGDVLKVADVCRWFCNQKPYKNDPYRLYSACLSGGPDAVSAYAQSNVQKAFLRLINQMENKARKAPDSPANQNAMLVCLYGHILLAARSYSNAISSYIKAYNISNNDPLINLSLGIAFLHRAMNRQTDNRHLQIVQAFTFLFRYYDLRRGNGEACYNIARAFHQIGLFHLAIPYYETVLAEGSTAGGNSYVQEAAYNLCGIYMSTGAQHLAHMVMRDYCVI
ncbi:hypothetical protein DFJ74DRAFT_746437 [Hyaloraphidium curvatum]|nr:hypothetical protein DFJ74DRAFT_746437 [Hyaloraphidium curvatum]